MKPQKLFRIVMSLSLVLFIVIGNINELSASTTCWSGLVKNLWSDENSWFDTVPTDKDIANIFSTKYPCLIDKTVDARCLKLLLPDDPRGKGRCQLDITGGSLTVGTDFILGTDVHNGYRDSGIFNISGGTTQIKGSLIIGQQGEGVVNVYGGKLEVLNTIHIQQSKVAWGRFFYLYGGVVGRLNIYDGVVGITTN